jgi:hypothetical protein
MIRAMERAPGRKEAIEAETDKLTNERHGDVLNDGVIEVEALNAQSEGQDVSPLEYILGRMRK